MAFDMATFGQALARPGLDTRQWISFATVDADTPDTRSVLFQDNNGDALPWAPQILVTLQPSGIAVPCRVASNLAGNGEGSWRPFVAGDEVIVAVPEGNEMAGCTIIGRLNQSIDIFPATVAGMDATKNTFAFDRMRCPYVLETTAGFLMRDATTGAALTVQSNGQVTLNSGDQHVLVMAADGLHLGLSGGLAGVDMDPDANSTTVRGETINLVSSGMPNVYHLMTTEAVVNLLFNFMLAISTVTPGPLIGATLFASAIPIINAALLTSVTPATGTILPFLAGLQAAFFAQNSPVYLPAAIAADISGNPATTGAFPGVGRTTILVG